MNTAASESPPWYAAPERGVLYAVFDAAASEEVLPKLAGSGQPFLSLFEERGEPELSAAAPHLIMLDPQKAWASDILESGWGRRWAVFLRAPVHAQRVRTQLRRLLMAELPTGQKVMFRFYDPRILRVYLPSCLGHEVETFYGPIDAFYAFHEDQQQVDVFARSEDGSLQIATTRAAKPKTNEGN